MTRGLDREVLADGTVRLNSGNTVFVFARPKAGVLVVTIFETQLAATCRPSRK